MKVLLFECIKCNCREHEILPACMSQENMMSHTIRSKYAKLTATVTVTATATATVTVTVTVTVNLFG
jgi:hypothetical protein